VDAIERHESEVRSYVRGFPVVFDRAEGCELFDETGKRYLDFFAGAGVLNYGHNHPALRRPLLEYIERGGITHSLDMASAAKVRFLERFHEVVLRPRNLDYKVQFPGPTGTNAVEAALKLARKVKGRPNIVSFTNAFHGMTLGALALTGNAFKRQGAGVPLGWGGTATMPFEGYLGEGVDTLAFLDKLLEDTSSGLDKPAAVIVEPVQAEGGVNVASPAWLKRLREITRKHDVLLIADEIQIGCGRSGHFFGFEQAGIDPDIVVLSKSLSGYGLPFAVTLFRPELDKWSPGEHNGTFRGHNLAMVTAAAALDTFWTTKDLQTAVQERAQHIRARLEDYAKKHDRLSVRGRGFMQGLVFPAKDQASLVSKEAFSRGLIIETAGALDNVLKLMPPLTIDEASLDEGIDIALAAADAVLSR
jgi:diaminobutyrate-2-oxoglutarate transaminase